MSRKVLVLDLTHGGEVLAKGYHSSGAEVTAVDVYHTSIPAFKADLRDSGVRVLDTVPDEDFDLGVVPIHCPSHYLGPARCRRVITHHKAVGELANFSFPVVEITGARGKTSACHVLAHILRSHGKKVLLQTSRGLSMMVNGEEDIIQRKVSIAPASLLSLSEGEYDADIGVFEVSLGGTGVGDVSAVTTIGDNYLIAAGTKRAFDGKVQMIELAKANVVFPEDERELWQPHVPEPAGMTTFGPGGDVDIELPGALQLGRGSRLDVISKERCYHVRLSGAFLAGSYTTALSSALASACSLGLDLDTAISSLSTFKGVPGRGEISREAGGYSIRERNPGVSASSIEWNVHVLEHMYGEEDIGVVLDPVNQKVCEKLSLDDVKRVLAAHPSVKGAYVINMPGINGITGFRRIDGFHDVRGSHRTMIYCTKEGYR